MMNLIYKNNSKFSKAAQIADEAGVDCVLVDIYDFENDAKNVCQSFCEKFDDIAAFEKDVAYVREVKSVLKNAKLAVRINEWNDNSLEEIEKVIGSGTDYITVPHCGLQEAKQFISAVNHRAKTVLSFDTKELVDSADKVLAFEFDEAYIDSCDLMGDYEKIYKNEIVLESDIINLCTKLKANGIPFGVGNIGTMKLEYGDDETILMEYYRLGATATVTQYNFCIIDNKTDLVKGEQEFKEKMNDFRQCKEVCEKVDAKTLEDNHSRFEKVVQKMVAITEIHNMYSA